MYDSSSQSSSHTAGNDKQLPNRYTEKVVAFHCLRDFSITYMKVVMILFWLHGEKLSAGDIVVLVTWNAVQVDFLAAGNNRVLPNWYTEKVLAFCCFPDSSITCIKTVMILFWKNWEILHETFSVVLVTCQTVLQVNHVLANAHQH
jgi:hypothetical protein